MSSNNFYKISKGISLTPQSSTPTNPSNGDIYYDSTLNKFRKYENNVWTNFGSGGAGGINYVPTGDAESGTTNFATYANTASSRPVNGTGGSASVTWTTTSSNPINDNNSFVFTKPASNCQGQGVSYDFTIDSAFKAKVLQININYIVGSGTFVAGTTGSSATDSDVIVYLYDKTNGTLIEPSSFRLLSNSSSIADTFRANFQTASNSTSYRLIFHVASTSASAFTLLMDNIQVSPSQYIYGTPITDWSSFTPTGSWSTNTTYTGYYRRVGGNYEYDVNLTLAGAPTNAALSINLPNGQVIDSSKLGGNNIFTSFASGQGTNAGLEYNLQVVGLSGSTTAVNVIYQNNTTGAQNQLNATTPVTWASGNTLHLRFSVPIVGASSSVQMSDSADTRVVAASYTKIATQTISNNTNTTLIFGNKSFDTHGAFNVTTGVYTAPSSGYYSISGEANTTSTFTAGPIFLNIYNATSTIEVRIGNSYAPASTQSGVSGTGIIYANAGDQLQLRFVQTTGGSVTLEATGGIHIQKVLGPQAIAATETICMDASNTSGQSIPNNTLTTVTNWNKFIDSHGAFNATTGIFTAPATGKYQICSQLLYAGAPVANAEYDVQVAQNGSVGRIASNFPTGTTSGFASSGTVVAVFQLLAGDTISIKAYQNSGASKSLSTNVAWSYLSIFRIGL